MAKEYNYVRKTFTYDGKRYTVRGKNEKDVYMQMALKKKELEEGRQTQGGNMPVRKWVERCIDTYKTGQSEATRTRYMSRINRGILDYIGDRSLKSIRPIDVQEVLSHQSGKSQYQINQIYQALRFFFHLAKVNKLIAEDPTESLIKPKNGTKNSRRSLTQEEETVFLKVASAERFRVFLLMYYCGLRSSEAREAMGKDITVVADSGKVYPVLHVRGTKTANADRNVPIPEELYQLIKKTPQNAYLAPNEAGHKHDSKSFQRAFNSLRRAMNIEMGATVYRNQLIPPLPLADDFVPYCLRHTFCTNLCRKGVDIRIAQHLMGHSDIRLTANIYTHIDNSDVVAAARILSNSLE